MSGTEKTDPAGTWRGVDLASGPALAVCWNCGLAFVPPVQAPGVEDLCGHCRLRVVPDHGVR